MNSELLVIMAKYPSAGNVKTRLAAEIGHPAATELYRTLLEHFAHEFADAPFRVEWHYTPRNAPFRRLIGDNYAARPQPNGDLGARMQRIFEASFVNGHRRVVLIGTDAPEVGKRTVRRAFRMLRRYPAVLQPTQDGGYALIGLTVESIPMVPDLFSAIQWSTNKVMTQTRQRLHTLGMRFVELPQTFDVDTAADLAKLAAFYVSQKRKR
jgi:rSAM/selenodomain-associated transferase 1